MKSFDRWFSEQATPEPAKPTEEEIEAALPDGFYMRGGEIVFTCTGCGRENCEWFGGSDPSAEDFPAPDDYRLGGCSDRCIP